MYSKPLSELTPFTWRILVQRVSDEHVNFYRNNNITITYGDLAYILGIHALSVSYNLNQIHRFCNRNNLPRLNIIVVRKDTNKPGKGMPSDVVDFNKEISQVREHDWYQYKIPTSNDFLSNTSRVEIKK